MTAALVALGAGLLLLGVVAFGVIRNQARLLGAPGEIRRSPNLPVGAEQGSDPGETAAGRPPPLRTSRVGSECKPVVGVTPTGEPIEIPTDSDQSIRVLFMTSSCTSCQPIWSALGQPQSAVHRGVEVVVVTPSPSTESARRVRALAPPDVTVVMASEVWHAYGVTAAPWYSEVRDGVIAAEGRLPT